MKDTEEVMKKAFQMAKHQLGMPSEQAFCEHVWKPVNSLSKPQERVCRKCSIRQRAEISWVDVRASHENDGGQKKIENHSMDFDPGGFIPNDFLVDWYEKYQPVGSGPLSTMKVVCALIEQLADARGLSLPSPRGVKKRKQRSGLGPGNE